MTVDLSLIERIKDEAAGLVRESHRLPHCAYADLRLEVERGKWAYAEDGKPKGAGDDYGLAFGVRVIAGERLRAAGYWGQSLGSADLPRVIPLLRDGIARAHARALANAREKEALASDLLPLGGSLWDLRLAPIAIRQDTVPAEYRMDPLAVPLPEMVRYVEETSRSVKGAAPEIRYNEILAFTMRLRELFCSSEGAVIDQSFALTQGNVLVVARDGSEPQEVYDAIGHQRGWEVIAEGENAWGLPLSEFAQQLARDGLELCRAPDLRGTEKETVVVTDPHYNTLLVHEIVGHPTELDRGLKYETAYAGRSWLLRDLNDHQIGKPIASPLVTAYSDPSLPGYGHYHYDHEGTPGKKVVHIDRGVFRGFMNSRQTAALLGVEPNGSYKATEASLVPLIRMSTTVFAGGDRDPAEIIREVDDGYYLVRSRTPSISESRENFRISALKVYKIRRGEVQELYRNGGMVADSRSFLMGVDAVGSDFMIYPIPNCGKGQPMQVKRLGNGGPTLRSRARVTGV
jgi:TldD protein